MRTTLPFTARRTGRGSILGLLALAVIVALLASMPFVAYESFTSQLVTLFVLIILASMWNLLAGFGGLVSVGQQAFIGIGAYTVVALDAQGINPFIAVLFAAVTAGLLSIPTSWVAFRLRGDYFAIGTWVIAEVYRLVLIKFDYLGGSNGKSISGLMGIDPVLRSAVVYWFALGIAALTVFGCYWLLRSKIGVSLMSTRDDDVAAQAAGVDVTFVKRITYLISAIGCGLAGGILAVDSLRVQPSAIFSVEWSVYMILIVIIGGIGYLEGPIVGAIVFFVLQMFLADWGTWYLMILGVIGIVIAAWYPKGLWGLIYSKTQYRLFPIGYTLVPASATSKTKSKE